MAEIPQVPETMRAAAIEKFGPPDEVIQIEMLPVPAPRDHQILVQIEVAGVGVWEPEIVSGEFVDAKVHFPKVIGSDGEGRVAAVGARARRFKVGDRVYCWGFGTARGGTFAEYAAVPEDMAAMIPSTLKPEEAGALAIDGITALEGLDHARVREGKSVMIFGASGGVGHLALQLAKRLGARVFAVASGPDGVTLCDRLGADRSVDGHQDDVAARAHEFAPDGFDAALMFASKDGWQKELKHLRRGARIAYPNGVEPEPKAPEGVRAIAYDGDATPGAFQRLNQLIGKGPFHVELYRQYPLEEVSRALRDVRQHHLGKLAVQIKRAA